MNGKYMCINTYHNEEEYGIDFLCTKVYEYKDGYMHSTENGTDVWIPEEELEKYWVKVMDEDLFKDLRMEQQEQM